MTEPGEPGAPEHLLPLRPLHLPLEPPPLVLAHLLVPSEQFLRLGDGHDRFDDGDDEELEDQAAAEEGGELREGGGQFQVGVGQGERFQDVGQLVVVVFQGLESIKRDRPLIKYSALKNNSPRTLFIP